MLKEQNTQFSPYRGSIRHDFKLTLSHSFSTFIRFCQGEQLHLTCSIEWTSVWKEWIWKVIRWIWSPHLGWRRFASQLHRMSTVSFLNDLHVYNNLFVTWIVNCRSKFLFWNLITEKMNFYRSEPMTSNTGEATSIKRMVIFKLWSI